jgi:hypothetical protein
MRHGYSQEVSALKKKHSIGELSDDAYKASIEALRKKAHSSAVQWLNAR